jgi:hypothetical protein
MNAMLLVHILGGSVAVIAGYVALVAPKGRRLHRRAGMLFVYGMLAMGAGAIVVGLARDKVTWSGGISVAYLVITATITVRRKHETAPLIDGALMLVAIALAIRSYHGGFVALAMPGARVQGIPAPVIFLGAVVMTLAAAGDARILLRGPLQGNQRIRRHLWRMCYAAFTATGSFFLGQAKTIPEPLRIWPVLIVLAVLPLFFLFYWLWRTSSGRRVKARPTLAPPPAGLPHAVAAAE